MTMLRMIAREFGIPLLPDGEKSDTRVYQFTGNAMGLVGSALQDRGFKVRTFGTPNADALNPDFRTQGYDSGTLWIFDPTGGNGALTWDAEYTWVWRASHEYGHAVTLDPVNRMFGDGKRAGKLGEPLTLNDCARALYWELLAFDAQWQFLREVDYGFSIDNSQADYWRESAVNLMDALYRSLTGEFSDPATEGIDIKRWLPIDPTTVYWRLRNMLFGASLLKG